MGLAVIASKASLGLSHVDDVHDADKPISSATQTALDAKGTSNFSGNYSDLGGKPALGSAATANTTDFDAAGAAASAQSAAATDATTKADAVQSGLNDEKLKTKYMLALVNRVHMELDLHTELSSLTPLSGGDNLATAGSHLSLLISALIDHFGDFGASAFTDAPHLVNDAASGSGLGSDVSSLPNQILRVTECAVAVVAHGNAAGVHFNNDTTSSGTAYVLPVAPPITQANVNSCINSLIAAALTHNGKASF